MTKDEALCQAKLEYLKQHDGRLLAPQYWAGLVIMGDISPILFKENNKKWCWIVAGGVILLIIAFVFSRRKTFKKAELVHAG